MEPECLATPLEWKQRQPTVRRIFTHNIPPSGKEKRHKEYTSNGELKRPPANVVIQALALTSQSVHTLQPTRDPREASRPDERHRCRHRRHKTHRRCRGHPQRMDSHRQRHTHPTNPHQSQGDSNNAVVRGQESQGSRRHRSPRLLSNT